MTSGADRAPQRSGGEHVPVEELARRQDIQPVESVDELAIPDMWESDEELEEFLADLYASRHADAQ